MGSFGCHHGAILAGGDPRPEARQLMQVKSPLLVHFAQDEWSTPAHYADWFTQLQLGRVLLERSVWE